MLRKYVPGHFRAYTFWLLLVVATYLLLTIGAKEKVGIIILVLVILFLGDQATHLHQHHDQTPPTALERLLQKHPFFFQMVSIGLAALLLEEVLK